MKFNQIKGRSFVVKGTGRGMKGDKHILINMETSSALRS